MTDEKNQVGAVIEPLTTDAERLSLQVARYLSHVDQLNELMAVMDQLANDVQQLDRQRAEKMAQVARIKTTVTFFVAEAREQVGLLLQMGMSQEEINKIAVPRSVVRYFDITKVLPDDVRARLTGKA